jgi:hypothetical protein
MFRIFRQPRIDALNRKRLGRYLGYATGEIFLVVVGILIALQIDNWNDDREESATLESYLDSIARNVQSDIAELMELRERRQENLLNLARVQPIFNNPGSYDVNEVFVFSSSVDYALRSLYFIPDSSGYDALKNSGVLDRLQGREIEQVLSDYYDTLGKIQRLESEYNNSVKSIGSIFDQTTLENDVIWTFFDPSAVPPEEFPDLQPFYRRIIRGAAARKLFNSQQIDTPSILLNYEKAIATGNLLVQMVGPENISELWKESHRNQLADSALTEPNPDLIANGAISFDSYVFLSTSSNNMGQDFTPDLVDRKGDALRLYYPGSKPVPGIESWAVFWLQVNDTAFGRPSRDFSAYDTLQLELKGSLGGENLNLHLKDKDDPDDGSQTNIELVLTDQWQTYDIGLNRFVNADLSKLFVVTGFLLVQQHEPISFWVRNVRFINKEAN